MTTKTSPGQTWKLTSRTAVMHPVCSRSSARERSASGVPMMRSACGPKTFQTSVDRDQRIARAVDAPGRARATTGSSGPPRASRSRSPRGSAHSARERVSMTWPLADCPTPSACFRRNAPQTPHVHTTVPSGTAVKRRDPRAHRDPVDPARRPVADEQRAARRGEHRQRVLEAASGTATGLPPAARRRAGQRDALHACRAPTRTRGPPSRPSRRAGRSRPRRRRLRRACRATRAPPAPPLHALPPWS